MTNELLRIDVGHLCSEKKTPNGITAKELNALSSKYEKPFQEFQEKLKAGQYPITLSLEETNAVKHYKTLAQQLSTRYENVLIIGIGGSALGAKAILQYLKGPFYNLEKHSTPRIFVLDNLDPVLVKKLEELLDIRKTVLIYVSKSGSTPETAANFIHFYNKYREAGGNVQDLVIMCDPGDNGLNRIAQRLGCHHLPIPRSLPGRYSVLSCVGFLPAEIAGIDSAQLLAGAQQMHQAICQLPAAQNGLFALGMALSELANRGRKIHVMFNYSSMLFEFGLWFMQLWAESLGKKNSLDHQVVHTGTTPLACTGATDQHSLLQLFKEGPADKVFGFLKVEQLPEIVLANEFPSEKEYAYFAGHSLAEQLHIEQLSTEMSLVRTGHPCYLITLRDNSPACLGALFYFYEALVIFTAQLWNINPFDQPGVEEGKNITYAMLGREDYASSRPQHTQDIEKHNQARKVFKV
ncbi:MAG: glucose-6-phosphate isomerase [Syntrophomonadaceae bacterium]|nr:glucose-6-phosphate isomerase [Syntrophomonadaceae bacterium]